jgi:Ca2+-binding EF-hand superfamily protein
MDVDGSGEITREELREAVTLLAGEDTKETTVAALIDEIDIDHDGSVNEHEFVAWLEHSKSRLQVSKSLQFA